MLYFYSYIIHIKMNEISVPKHEWDEALVRLLSSFDVYAPIENEFCCDYVKLVADIVPQIVYNKPKPVTPLKNFFLPVKENVTSETSAPKPLVILGIPNCDVMALALLDAIYLDKEYTDPAYKERRDHTTIVSSHCLSVQEHCHCTSYGINPVGNEHSDLSLALVGDQLLITIYSQKGEFFVESLGIVVSRTPDKEQTQTLNKLQKNVLTLLKEQNKEFPDHHLTGKLISEASDQIWNQYASSCVSCGACSAICPTCSCFLLIDKPGFQKIRQLDTCQYPGFERVAGGEDALSALSERFRNRFMCKYVWKPEQYQTQSCTGCGRCIEACIGQINKNELIVELSK
jgi:sulfhydrogenase subunit beta (sulfur reductase)